MREATNLNWTETPFGAARRPFADRTSLLAAFSINAAGPSPSAAAAVYLPVPRACSLAVTDTTLRFGFHAVAAEESAETLAVVATVDALLVQARRQAAVIAGHRFADELAALAIAGGVVHGKGEFDLETEVDLFAAQLSSQLRTARQHTMIIADKTIANVLAYAWLVLPGGPDGPHAPVLRAMETFCRAWAHIYDAVFYCVDKFDQHQIGDPYRSRVLDIQPAADRVVRSTCATVGQRIYDIPPNMSTGQRVSWIADQLTTLGLDPTTR